jgi:hypothetical protein
MKPGTLNFTIYQGATFRLPLIWKTKVDTVSTPVDITIYKIRMQLRKKVKDEEIILELSTDNGKIVKTVPEEGKFELVLSSIDTSELLFNQAVYDLEFYIEAEAPEPEFVVRLLSGLVTLDKEITRKATTVV